MAPAFPGYAPAAELILQDVK